MRLGGRGGGAGAFGCQCEADGADLREDTKAIQRTEAAVIGEDGKRRRRGGLVGDEGKLMAGFFSTLFGGGAETDAANKDRALLAQYGPQAQGYLTQGYNTGSTNIN